MINSTKQQSALFADRSAAGRDLLPALTAWDLDNPLLLALPRGGVSVCKSLAQQSRNKWDVLLVAKIATAEQPELAIGAVSEYGPVLLTPGIEDQRQEPAVQQAIQNAQQRIDTQRLLFRGNQEPPAVAKSQIVIIDDGLATGWTVRAAVSALQQAGAAEIYGLFPVGPVSTSQELQPLFTKFSCLHQPDGFRYVSDYYQRFFPVSDKAVIQALDTRGSLALGGAQK